jgi:hypothetical protein
MNRTAHSMTRLAVPLILLSPLCAEAAADISYLSAHRGTWAEAHTSGETDRSGPSRMETNLFGSFQGHAFAWSSGDYGAESDSWQRSSLTQSAIRIEQSADTQINGFDVPGTWDARSESFLNITFTVTDLTPYWIIMETPPFFGQSGGLVRIANLDGGELLFTGEGAWEGFLNPGTYSMGATVSAQNVRYSSYIEGGWLFAGIGVPTPATASILALGGAFTLRRRRA